MVHHAGKEAHSPRGPGKAGCPGAGRWTTTREGKGSNISPRHRAKDGGEGDLPAGKDGPHEEHGEYVEEAVIDIDQVLPVDQRDGRNEGGSTDECCAGGFQQYPEKHIHRDHLARRTKPGKVKGLYASVPQNRYFFK